MLVIIDVQKTLLTVNLARPDLAEVKGILQKKTSFIKWIFHCSLTRSHRIDTSPGR